MQDRTVPSWFLMALGLTALAGIAVITVVQLVPGDDPPAALPPPQPAFTLPATLPPPQPAFTLPATTTGPQAPVSLIPTSAGTAHATATHSYRTSKPPPRSAVTGAYSVLQSFGDSFIGQVELTNTTGRQLDWRVVLVFPSDVGDLRASWLESLPQPSLRERGQTYTWTSSVPLAARSKAQLRFHFDRAGSGDTPSSCTVNGSPCRQSTR